MATTTDRPTTEKPLRSGGSSAAASHWVSYTGGAIVLHWLIALMILGLFASGLWMSDAIHDESQRQLAFTTYQIHKSVGLTVLGLTVLRIVWRLLHPVPPLPEGMSGFERFGAHASHMGFYVLMLAMPLSGWAMVSVSPSSVATFYFELFQVPHLPVLAELAIEAKEAAEPLVKNAHAFLAYGAMALLILHVAAALKHHFFNRDAVLARMVPGVSPRGMVSEPAHQRASFAAWRVLTALLLIAGTGAGVWGLSTLQAERVAATSQGLASSELATPAVAGGQTAAWGVVAADSSIQFSGSNAGSPFEGEFKEWQALINFDPAALDQSEIVVIINVASATIGSDRDDASMKEPDWFNVAKFPKATYTADTFETTDGGGYVAKGSLTIRGVEKPVDLPFDLTIDGARAEAKASLIIDRAAFDVGTSADPSGAFVSLEIPVEIAVVAKKAE